MYSLTENVMDELNDLLTIDAVSRQLDITPRTLRYYEEVGLISPAYRTAGRQRLYNQSTIERLKHIIRLKEYLGISLQEIQEVIDAEEALKELRMTFLENDESADGQRLIVERYINFLHNLIDKMNTKIENVLTLRDLYREQVERSMRYINKMEKN